LVVDQIYKNIHSIFDPQSVYFNILLKIGPLPLPLPIGLTLRWNHLIKKFLPI
jgi:hypothetical protein